MDDLNRDRLPREGFEYPEVGATLVAVVDYRLPSGVKRDHKSLHRDERGDPPILHDGLIHAKDKGTVKGLRKPGYRTGYMGLVVEFESIKPAYRSGLVIPWDIASDPSRFRFE